MCNGMKSRQNFNEIVRRAFYLLKLNSNNDINLYNIILYYTVL